MTNKTRCLIMFLLLVACQIEDPIAINMPLAGMSSGATEAGLEGVSMSGSELAGVSTSEIAGEVAGIAISGADTGAGAESDVETGAGAGVVGGSGGEPSVSFEPGYALYPAEGELLTRTATFNSSLTLSARYTFSDGETIAGVPAQAITLRLLDPTGSDRTATGYLGSRLQSSRVFSTDQGLISFNLFIGDQEGSFTIEVSALDATPLSFVINVIAEG